MSVRVPRKIEVVLTEGPQEGAMRLVFSGSRLLGMFRQRALWEAYPWYTLNGACEPFRGSIDSSPISVHTEEQAAADAVIAEARRKGRMDSVL